MSCRPGDRCIYSPLIGRQLDIATAKRILNISLLVRNDKESTPQQEIVQDGPKHLHNVRFVLFVFHRSRTMKKNYKHGNETRMPRTNTNLIGTWPNRWPHKMKRVHVQFF